MMLFTVRLPAAAKVGIKTTTNESSGGPYDMATIKITTVKCIRKQDVVGKDEPVLYIAAQKVWDAKMDRDEILHPNISRTFSGSVAVELREQNDNYSSEKSLGKWTVNQTPTAVGNPPLTATSSGYHYEVWFDVYS
jgi:hypothetical protein